MKREVKPMKTKKPLIAALIAFAAALTVLLGAQPGYYLYRELEYQYGTPSEAARQVHAYAQEQDIPYGSYPRDLIELLENNPETEEFVLQYPFRTEQDVRLSHDRDTVPLFLQWDRNWGYEKYGSSYLAVTGCGPTCLAMVGYYLTGDPNMTPHQIAKFAEKNGYYERGYGSSWTLISEGSTKLGLTAKELPLVKSKLVNALIEDETPIVLAMGAGDFTSSGHYIVLTDVEDGQFRVNDPNSRENSEKLWSYEQLEGQIRNIWAISKA